MTHKDEAYLASAVGVEGSEHCPADWTIRYRRRAAGGIPAAVARPFVAACDRGGPAAQFPSSWRPGDNKNQTHRISALPHACVVSNKLQGQNTCRRRFPRSNARVTALLPTAARHGVHLGFRPPPCQHGLAVIFRDLRANRTAQPTTASRARGRRSSVRPLSCGLQDFTAARGHSRCRQLAFEETIHSLGIQ